MSRGLGDVYKRQEYDTRKDTYIASVRKLQERLHRSISSITEQSSVTEMSNALENWKQQTETELEKRTGMTITISEYDFMGGMRAVIRGRNILIDHSFQAAVDYEYHQFSFAAGGAGIE